MGNDDDHKKAHKISRLCRHHQNLHRSFFLLVMLVVQVAAAGWLLAQVLQTIPSLSSSSKHEASSTMDPKKAALQLARERFQRRMQQAQPQQSQRASKLYSNMPLGGYRDLSQIAPDDSFSHFQQQHDEDRPKLLTIYRIPKAGSSALSVWARALAGCRPDGYPCCNYPGNPAGSCPLPGLLCAAVRGCIGHRPNLNHGSDEPTITNIRDPTRRLLSAFFYAPPHRPEQPGHDWSTFATLYVPVAQYRNVLTKMLNGQYAYDPFDDDARSTAVVAQAQATACRLAWFGMSDDKPLLSALLLYEAPAFAVLAPNPVVFVPMDDGRRVNADPQYAQFQRTTFVEHRGAELVRQYNREDWEVYDFMHRLFCLRVRETAGLLDDLRKAGIAKEEIAECQQFLAKAPAALTVADLCPS